MNIESFLNGTGISQEQESKRKSERIWRKQNYWEIFIGNNLKYCWKFTMCLLEIELLLFSNASYLKSFIFVHCFPQVVITFVFLSNIIIMDSPELPSESTFLLFLVQDPHMDTTANMLISTP